MDLRLKAFHSVNIYNKCLKHNDYSHYLIGDYSMTKSEFVEKIKHECNLKSHKVSAELVDNFVKVLTESLKNGEEVNFLGFGKFTCENVPARTCRNLQTGEMIEVPERKRVKFKASASLKKVVNE